MELPAIRFWFRDAPRWAWDKTIHITRWSTTSIIFSLIAFVAGCTAHYLAFGRQAVMEEIWTWLTYVVVGAGSAFVLTCMWNLLRAPGHMLAEAATSHNAQMLLLQNKVRAQEEELNARPRAELALLREGDQWWVEVRNHNADADYVAMIDFAETSYSGYGRDPSFVQWSTKSSKELEKRIPAGSRARFFLYGVVPDRGMYRPEFRYIRDDNTHKGHGRYSWTNLSDPPTPVHDLDKGVLKIIVTAEPPLQGGPVIARFGFDGHSVRIISGEVQQA